MATILHKTTSRVVSVNAITPNNFAENNVHISINFHLAKYLIKAVTPCDTVCFLTSYYCASKISPLPCGCLEFNLPLQCLPVYDITLLNEPFGSGKLSADDKLLPDLGLKYFNTTGHFIQY